jgi:hypothetical protein
MKRLKTAAFLSLCLFTGNLMMPGAHAANPGTTPLTYGNAVSFFKAAKLRGL